MNLDLFMAHFGWLGPWLFFIGATIEALPFIGTFLPGATIVTLGGFAAAQGYFSLSSVIIFSIAGAIVGDAISYYIGTHGGNYLRRKRLVKESLLQKGEDFFNKYGNQSLLWGRFIGPIRSVMPFLAGLAKLKQKAFWTWNVFGGIAWGIFYVMLGHFSGNLFLVIIKRWSYRLAWLVLLLTIVPLMSWLNKHHKESVKQYFRNRSDNFAKRVENYRLTKYIEKRYPAFSEFFIWKSSKLKLYLAFFGFLFLIIISIIALIFDWI